MPSTQYAWDEATQRWWWHYAEEWWVYVEARISSPALCCCCCHRRRWRPMGGKFRGGPRGPRIVGATRSSTWANFLWAHMGGRRLGAGHVLTGVCCVAVPTALQAFATRSVGTSGSAHSWHAHQRKRVGLDQVLSCNFMPTCPHVHMSWSQVPLVVVDAICEYLWRCLGSDFLKGLCFIMEPFSPVQIHFAVPGPRCAAASKPTVRTIAKSPRVRFAYFHSRSASACFFETLWLQPFVGHSSKEPWVACWWRSLQRHTPGFHRQPLVVGMGLCLVVLWSGRGTNSTYHHTGTNRHFFTNRHFSAMKAGRSY